MSRRSLKDEPSIPVDIGFMNLLLSGRGRRRRRRKGEVRFRI
jgi:hypothetical protein